LKTVDEWKEIRNHYVKIKSVLLYEISLLKSYEVQVGLVSQKICELDLLVEDDLLGLE